MFIIEHRISKEFLVAEVIPIEEQDFKHITKIKFWFNWKKEKEHDVYKIRIKGTTGILGLLSLENHPEESRIEIRLLAVSKENRGRKRKYGHIAGNLIASACIRTLKQYGEWTCVSLVPKTDLIDHYMKKYKFQRAGRSLFLDGRELIELIRRYDHDG